MKTVSTSTATPEALAEAGLGKICYVKMCFAKDAKDIFPDVEEIKSLPGDTELFALYGADGVPLALTDSRNAAIGHGVKDKLTLSSIH